MTGIISDLLPPHWLLRLLSPPRRRCHESTWKYVIQAAWDRLLSRACSFSYTFPCLSFFSSGIDSIFSVLYSRLTPKRVYIQNTSSLSPIARGGKKAMPAGKEILTLIGEEKEEE
ncbi:hypothetical protein TcWFU_006353 [Taenia crassiceps]|uniref:Uncharacterized protein n=1 Tax=Taenia crassiceps TaxID=6207 RepID=A0ABR4Q6W1_9CEST